MRLFKHREAFCVMQYASEDGKVTETLWNSRDGVTPFCVMAKDDVTMMQHVKWDADDQDPFHKPKPGDRVFVDLTSERAAVLVEAVVEAWFDTEERRAFAKDQGMTKDRLRDIKQTEMKDALARGEPDVITATVEWVQEIRRRQDAREGFPMVNRKLRFA